MSDDIRLLADLRRPVFLLNSRLGPFAAASKGSGCSPSPPEAPLVPKLRGDFAEFLLHGSPVHLRLFASPTCVGLRYGSGLAPPVAFPGGPSAGSFDPKTSLPERSRIAPTTPDGHPSGRPLHLPRHDRSADAAPELRTLRLIPFDYASRPRLRIRLTPRGLALRGKPWACGAGGSRPRCRYSCQHSRFCHLHRASRRGFHGLQNALLPLPLCRGSPQLRRCT